MDIMERKKIDSYVLINNSKGYGVQKSDQIGLNRKTDLVCIK